MSQTKKVNLLKEVGIVKVLLLVGLICVLIIIFAINHYINSIDISGLSNVYPQPTIIYDKDGEVASKISSSKINGIGLDEMPQHLIDAVISIEDHRFYKHPGVDYIGITRAVVKNLKARAVVEGGSTITQQLTKNVFLTHEQSFERKLEEFFIAQKIERTFSKDEIIEMYLNTVYFGEGAWGIRNAAATYFGKEVDELTISESATLAGLLKAPSRLSPVKNYDQSIERRNVVLSAMKRNEVLTNKEYDEAITSEIALHEKKVDPYEGKYPYYVDHIIDEAIEKYGLTQNEILAGGLHIYTELDQTMQTAVEEVFKDDSIFPESAEDQLIESGTILLNAKDGGIHALVGGRGERVFRGFNRATHLKRQPGSTMKPLAVYTPALESGYNMYDILPDQPVKFGDYQPLNYNGGYKGSVTMIDALKSSDNVPAVWLLNEIGLNMGMDSIRRFGIELTERDRNLSVALGGLDKGLAPIDMAEAYAAFANEGVRSEAHAITRIVDVEGEVVAEWEEEQIEVTTADVAEKMTYMLRQVVEQGTGRNAKLANHELAGKTGSTQVPIEGVNGSKDQWFVGYTPDVVGALWLGYDKTDEHHYLTTTSSTTATVIFKAMMDQALIDLPPTSFSLSSSYKQQPVNKTVNQERKEPARHTEISNQHHKKEKDKEKNRGRGKGKENNKGRNH
ncbi:transglycosylase domain-containing protein [Bacillus sp. PS06]|uniref:transglycosylase domain-containing protein n=1 Tax=Bacillus sp. PS06 TaxID=2764176 RepID=UPI00177EF958|nr:PBP1A family penicillin-binding protein [Bacillus sp. PS06]MBD8067768.1 PBP1A family penicillin-binding protein [Bacillus sp. PS06]